MVAVHFLLPRPQIIAWPYRWAGLALMAGGAALAASVIRLFRKAGTTVKPLERSTALITRGPFRVSRNPIYLGLVAILAGLATLLGTLAPWALVPAFIVIITQRFIQAEEKMLDETFGQEYRRYMQRVRRWL